MAQRIDASMRFRWLQANRAFVSYQGEECVITVSTRKTPFRGESLTGATNQGIAAMPVTAATGTKSAAKTKAKPSKVMAGAGK